MKKINFFKDLYLYFKNRYRIKYIVEINVISIQDTCYRMEWDNKPGVISNWCIENCIGRWIQLEDKEWGFSHIEDSIHFKMAWYQ